MPQGFEGFGVLGYLGCMLICLCQNMYIHIYTYTHTYIAEYIYIYIYNVNLVLLNPLILKCARGPGRNNKAVGIKYAKSGLVFFGGV